MKEACARLLLATFQQFQLRVVLRYNIDDALMDNHWESTRNPTIYYVADFCSRALDRHTRVKHVCIVAVKLASLLVVAMCRTLTSY